MKRILLNNSFIRKSFLSEALWLIKSIKKKRRIQLFKLILLMMACAFFEVLAISLVVPFLGLLIDPAKINDFSVLNYIFNFINISNPILLIGFSIILVNIINLYLRLLNIRKANQMAARIGTDMCINLFKVSINQPYERHIEMNSSYLITAVTQDIGRMVISLSLILQMITGLMISILIMFSLIIINYKIALLSFLGFGTSYFLVANFARSRLSKNSQIIADSSNKQVKLIQEVLGSIKEILLYQNQYKYIKDQLNLDYEIRQLIANNVFLSSFPKFVLETIGIILISIFGIILSFEAERNIEIISTLGVFALSAQRLLPSMQQIYLGWSSFKGNKAHIKRVRYLISREALDFEGFADKDVYKFTNEIKFNNVTFNYYKKDKQIFKDINFSIKKGEKIRLIGRTGAGKSTLVDLIMGLLVPLKGDIMVDSLKINKKSNFNKLLKWQREIAYVPQNIFLKDASFTENIAFGIDKKNIDFEKVQKSAEKALIIDFIMNTSKGFQTKVGERGVLLSGGQAQRIALARAFYRDSQILIFDEATSALDIATEEKVTNSIFDAGKEITLIMIAHRLSTLENCDRILFLDNNKLLEVSYNDAKILMKSLS